MRLIDIGKGQQSAPSYLAVSPLGKVPALLIGTPLLENAAILTLIHAMRPDAQILPPDDDPLARAEGVGGLSFCGGTLHPIARGLFNPG
ncbi:MAG: glutathione S-transferase [Bradyrhizobium sp.]|nr:glutathione S-transferase [Bradyrhizobium sp.]